MTLGGIIQTAPEMARSQRGLARTFMCTIVCSIVPEGETKDDCERVNCDYPDPGESTLLPDDYNEYGDYVEPVTQATTTSDKVPTGTPLGKRLSKRVRELREGISRAPAA